MKIEPEWKRQLLRCLFTLAGLVVPLLVGHIIIKLWRLPTTGFAVLRSDYDTVAIVFPGGPAAEAGVQAGDVLLTVDGIPHADWPGPGRLGQVHTMEIDRDGRRLTLFIPTVPMLRFAFWEVTSVAVLALALWGIGMLLLWRRFERSEVRLLFVLGQMMAIAILGSLESPASAVLPSWIFPLSGVCFAVGAPAFLHYHITFPARLGTHRQRRSVLTLVYGLSPVILASGLWGNMLVGTLAVFCIILEVVLAISAALYAYARRSSPDDRRRLRIIVFGTILGLLPPILLYTIPYHIRGPAALGVPRWLARSFIAIAPLSYLVATVRHNLFGIDRLLNRALVYGLLSLTIFALYLGPFLALARYAPDDPLIQTAVVAGLTLLVGLGFSWTRERVQRLVDRLFYGGWYDYPGVVETISDALAHSLDREQLTDVLARQVADLMQLHEGRLWLGDPGAVPAEKPPHPQMQIPLTFEEQVRGLWTVGARRDGEDFSVADRRILQTLAHQAEIGLSNVLLVETLRHQLDEVRKAQRQLLRSREEERARLARELHDGPIQSLVGLNVQVGLLLTPSQGGDSSLREELAAMRAEVRGLLNELRQVCAELRPPMLDTMGLGAALRALAEEWSSQNSIKVTLDFPSDTSLRALPDEVAINLFRVAQEAMANIARHAQARRVAIRLTWEQPRLALTVQDDGRGFAAPPNLNDLAAGGHFGLAGMQERVDLVGGTLAMESAPGHGTTVCVTWEALDSEASK